MFIRSAVSPLVDPGVAVDVGGVGLDHTPGSPWATGTPRTPAASGGVEFSETILCSGRVVPQSRAAAQQSDLDHTASRTELSGHERRRAHARVVAYVGAAVTLAIGAGSAADEGPETVLTGPMVRGDPRAACRDAGGGAHIRAVFATYVLERLPRIIACWVSDREWDQV
jgi:Flp pilus assembly protein CpaB